MTLCSQLTTGTDNNALHVITVYHWGERASNQWASMRGTREGRASERGDVQGGLQGCKPPSGGSRGHSFVIGISFL